MPPALLLLFVAIHLGGTFRTTICDCKNPTKTGLMQFASTKCSPQPLPHNFKPVTYDVFSTQHQAAKFPAVICARWKNVKQITMNFFAQTVVVPQTIPLETSAIECRIMQQGRRCNDQPMTIVDRKWICNQEPSDGGSWLSTITEETIACTLEELNLLQDANDNTITTPLGKTNATTGSVIHNHLTVIWDTTYAAKLEQEPILLESGTAKLINTSVINRFRLQDDIRQLEFHITPKKNCSQTIFGCTKENNIFSVIGESDMYIIVLPTNATLRYPFTTLWAQAVAPPRITTNNVDISAHLQYIRDKLVEQENELSQLIETEQCEINTLRHSQSLATAQYNGWLAAYQLGFPNCTKLSAAGQTALVITCTPIEITFETEVTSCGPQPRFRNWTINLDGWELVQYSPCYWRMGFVNFNNKPHAYRNGSWIPIEASIVVPEKKLTNTFRYDDIVFFDYEHQSNPAYTDTIIDHMTIMADIAAAMTEHSSNFTEVFITATSSVFGMPNWLANLRSYAILFACIVVILIITRICFKCGCCKLVWKLCCRISRPSAVQGTPIPK